MRSVMKKWTAFGLAAYLMVSVFNIANAQTPSSDSSKQRASNEVTKWEAKEVSSCKRIEGEIGETSNRLSSSTSINVKVGQEAVVTGIWPGTIRAAFSTTVSQVIAALQATNNSMQTYEVYTAHGGTKISTGNTVLMTTNMLKVTAEDNCTTAEYAITVNPVGDSFLLTPVTTTTGSETSVNKAVNATNNSGMSGYYGTQDTHDNDANGATMWLTDNNPRSSNWIQLDLGAIYPLGKMLVWNYNQPGTTNKGVKNAQVLYSTDGLIWTNLGGSGKTQQFAQASGSATEKANTTVDFSGVAARYVKIVPNETAGDGNWNAKGPTSFGLSQIRIYRYTSYITEMDQNVTALDVTAGSVNSTYTPAINTVNNFGMSGSAGKTDVHNNAVNSMWLTAVNPGANNWIKFDLGGTYPLSEMHVWNYNAFAGEYGIKNAQVQYSVDGTIWTTLGAYQFAKASGSRAQGPTDLVGGGVVNFNGASVRYVKIVPNSAASDGNWSKNAIFGLSQVRFYSAPGTIIEPARDWTALVTKTSGWTGSDGIYSIAYNGYDAPGKAGLTKTLFLFSDTFVGNANPVSKYRNVSDFTNNTLGVLDGGNPDPAAMNYIWGKDANGKTTSGLFVPRTPKATPDNWYWLQDGINLNNNVYISAMNVAPDPTQPAGWQFKVVGVSMIKVPINQGQIDVVNQTQVDTSLLYHTEFQWGTKKDANGNDVPNMLTQENQFGAGFMPNTAEAGAPNPDGYVYTYGYQTVFGVRGLLVARVLPSDFENESKWMYYGNNGWTSDISAAKIISDSHVDVSPELSVTPIIGGPNDGKYRLVYSTGVFSADHGLIKESIGNTPVGPFGPPTTLYYTPEDKSYAANTFIYNAKAHPNISKPGELLISYNVNSTEDGGNVHYVNGEMYHPRFVNMRQIYSGTNTGIGVKFGHNNVVSQISAGTIHVSSGSTVNSVTDAVYSNDGSAQTYEVYTDGTLGTKITDGTTALLDGNIWKVTAADHRTTEEYVISIDKHFTASLPATAVAGSENTDYGITAPKTVDDSGMSGTDGKTDTHDNTFSNMWATPEDADDTNNWIQFDLGRTTSLGEMFVWNYNEDDGTGWLKNGTGIRYATVQYSVDGENWIPLGADGHYEFAKAANGTAALAPTNLVGGGVVDFGGANARYVRITPNSATDANPGNYGGVFEGAFGIQSTFGLSEVRFYPAPIAP